MSKETFIDLFAGLGGFRIGMTRNSFVPVFGSDFNKHAAATYKLNFGETIFSDITQIEVDDIPSFDVMCGGFPCQPFSRAGKLGGFQDTRGTLFFDLCKIINEKQPKVVFLENVKNLTTHDKGNTFTVIQDSLKSLGYSVSYEILNAVDFGVPQSRERIIIVAVKGDTPFDFSKVKKVKDRPALSSFLDKKEDSEFEWLDPSEYTLIDPAIVKTQIKTGLRFVGYRNKNMRIAGIRANSEHLSRTHKQPNRIYSDAGTHPTLSAQEKSGRYFIETTKKDGTRAVRKLTLDECYRIFGYPDTYKHTGALGEQYARIGNSICVPMVQAISKQIRKQCF